MNKIIAISLLLSLHFVAYSSIADISFTGKSWIFTNGVSQTNNQIEIIGTNSGYRTATLTIDIPANTEMFYLVADVYFSNIVCGDAAHKAPKFKMYKSDGSKFPVLNFYNPLENRWVTTGVKVEKNTETQITIEFGMQSASGTMLVKNPQLLSEPPVSGDLEFPFDMPADKGCTLNVDLQNTRPFNNDKLSSNTHFTWSDYGWADDEVRQVINEHFPITNLRFPGGTVGNFYDWRRDGYYENQYSYDKGYSMAHRVGYPGFEAFSISSGASSTLMFNVISETVEVARQRLQNRIDDGLDIAWIEMGNENYFIGTQGIGQVDSEENYITHTKALTAGLKEVKNDVKVAVNVEHDGWEAGDWNYNLANEDYYDATVMHGYVQTNTFLLNPVSAFTMLNAYKTAQERFEAYKNLFGDTPLLMTEWNVLSDDTPLNFIQTLSVADMFLAIEQEEVVKQAGIHMLFKSDEYHESTLTYNINSQMVLTANGAVYAKLFDVFKNRDVYSSLSASAELVPGLPAVIARAIDHGDHIKVFAVNKLPESSRLHLSFNDEVYAGDFMRQSFHEDVNTELTEPYLSPEEAFQSFNEQGKIVLPAYSLSVITINKQAISTDVEFTEAKRIDIRYVANDKLIKINTDNQFIDWCLYSINGIEVARGQEKSIHVNHLRKGIYIVQVANKRQKVLIY